MMLAAGSGRVNVTNVLVPQGRAPIRLTPNAALTIARQCGYAWTEHDALRLKANALARAGRSGPGARGAAGGRGDDAAVDPARLGSPLGAGRRQRRRRDQHRSGGVVGRQQVVRYVPRREYRTEVEALISLAVGDALVFDRPITGRGANLTREAREARASQGSSFGGKGGIFLRLRRRLRTSPA